MKSNHDGVAVATEGSAACGVVSTSAITERLMLSPNFCTAAGDRKLFALGKKFDRLVAKSEATLALARRIKDIDRRWRFDEVYGDRIAAADAVVKEASGIVPSSIAALRLKARMAEWLADRSAAHEAAAAEYGDQQMLWSLVRDILTLTSGSSMRESLGDHVEADLCPDPRRSQRAELPPPQH